MINLLKTLYRKAVIVLWNVRSGGKKAAFTVDQLNEIQKVPLGKVGTVELDGRSFKFHHAGSFVETYKEVFIEEIYKFHPTGNAPYILDCGANMGLSVLYFSTQFPNATIEAFEPEKPIYNVLAENIRNYGLTNVTVHNKAVWNAETTLKFFTDTGMGGSVENTFSKQVPTLVPTVRLKDFLQRQVDFLKIDIEGAEFTVLQDCKDALHHVQHLFVEYHSYQGKEQHLDDLLVLLKNAGFRYHLRQSFSRTHPFVDTVLACENMDMAINVFAYRG